MKKFLAGALALTLLALVGCSASKPAEAPKPAAPATPPAPKIEKLVIGFVPSQDAAGISDKVKPMSDFLSKELGITVTTFVGSNFAGVVEGMGSKQVDIGFLNAFSYVAAHNDYGVITILKSVRKGNFQYRAQLTTRKADNIPVCDAKADPKCKATFDALKGKKLAFVDPGSTSGYLFPAFYLKNIGIDIAPGKFFSDVMNAGGHDKAVNSVYNKVVDAAWSFEDARDTLVKDFPDVKEKLVQVAFTDWIPNDGISVRKDLPADLVQKITDAFVKYSKDPDGVKVLQSLYTIDAFAPSKDADYQVVADTAKAMGIDLKAELQKKK
ncbi:MAG TPA: phosphate/phosphite/phosphonate ABC transporter substrate-binding protein [Symbiobacteriaceae bacterium]|jgi:phosphonate transport system substrate-binding protein